MHRFHALLATLLLFAAPACGSRDSPGFAGARGEVPDIVLITVDTLRADALESYGSTRTETPHSSLLAAEGIVFENAYTDTTWTLPAIASLLTGQEPPQHGVRNWTNRLAEDRETLAELLRERGYVTHAIVGSYPLDHRFGLAQGFDGYDDHLSTPLVFGAKGEVPADSLMDGERGFIQWKAARERSQGYRPDAEVTQLALEFLKVENERPIFLWVHYLGPHERDRGKDDAVAKLPMAERYRLRVGENDRAVGRLLTGLRARRRWKNTIVVLHSDHGEALSEHRVHGHGNNVFEETARVPLILRLPDNALAGTRRHDIVRNVDILPTLVTLSGARLPDGIAGVDLLDVDASRPPAFSESYLVRFANTRSVTVRGKSFKVGRVHRSVRVGRWKLVGVEWVRAEVGKPAEPLSPDHAERPARYRLFDLESAEREGRDRAAEAPEPFAALRGLLHERIFEGVAPLQPLDAAARAQLEALGYLRDAAAASAESD